jgi:hypothetical protein
MMCRADVIPLVVVVVVKTVSFDLKPPDGVEVTPASKLVCCVLLLVGCCCIWAAGSELQAVGVATKAEFSSLVMLM